MDIFRELWEALLASLDWQLAAALPVSHYLIVDGKILWARQWTEQMVRAGRREEERRRNAYYAERAQERVWWRRELRWLHKQIGG